MGTPVRPTHKAGDAAAGAGKSRVTLMQLVGTGVVVTMFIAVVYMYRVIESLHREQQAMRLQIAELTGTGYSSAPGQVVPAPRRDFLVGPRIPAFPADSARFIAHERRGPAAAWEMGADGDNDDDARKLASMFTTGTSAGVGCFELTDTATQSFDVSTTACNSNNCPDCFITPATVSQGITVTIQACSTAKWLRGVSRTGIWVYTFINSHASKTIAVTDNSASPVVHHVHPGSFIQAYCASTLGTTNKLYYPSPRVPSLIVDSGMTLLSGNFDGSFSSGSFTTSSGTNTLSGNVQIAGTKTFATGTGTVSLNGATTVKDNTAFNVGSSGAGGTSTLFGPVVVGSSTNSHSSSLTVHGNFAQNDDGSGTLKTFSTATGAVSINGHTTVASGKNLHMVSGGAGTFQTGTGTATLNGNTAITSAKTFSTGTGAVSLNGATTIADSTTFTVGSAGSGGSATFYGTVAIGGSASSQSRQLTLTGNFLQNDDASGTGSTFTTASGTNTIGGHTTVAAGKNLHMASGSGGSFTTGTGQVTLNGDTVITTDKTFGTGTGGVSLNGATAVADTATFTVGSPGSAQNSQLFGNVYIGSSQEAKSTLLDVYGNVRFLDDADGTTKSFTTATGTVSFNGHTTVGANKNLLMEDTGTGLFTTGTGPVTINGDTTVVNPRTFIVGEYTNRIVCDHDNTNGLTATFCKASR